MLHTFEKPRTIPEVLDWLIERIGPEEYHCKLRRKVTRKLSSAEQALLDTKWPAATFPNVRRVPQSYPTWALRNVSVETWSEPEHVPHMRTERSWNGEWYQWKTTLHQGMSDLAEIDGRDADRRDYGKHTGDYRGRGERKARKARGNSMKTHRWTDRPVNRKAHSQRALSNDFAAQQEMHLEDTTTRLVERPKIRQLRQPKPERITRPAAEPKPAPDVLKPVQGYVADGYARLIYCIQSVNK